MPNFLKQNQKHQKQNGFTLLELLVVIAIIGILAGIIIVATANSRQNAKLAKANADLHELNTAVTTLAIDTGKWPNGCPVAESNNPEVALDLDSAGIKTVPPVGVVDAPCEWTSEEVAKWRGPYAYSMNDAWGRSYYFDPDFYVCESGQGLAKPAIESYGPNGVQNYPSSCNSVGCACTVLDSDDIVLF